MSQCKGSPRLLGARPLSVQGVTFGKAFVVLRRMASHQAVNDTKRLAKRHQRPCSCAGGATRRDPPSSTHCEGPPIAMPDSLHKRHGGLHGIANSVDRGEFVLSAEFGDPVSTVSKPMSVQERCLQV
jgi:hypothetical protein